MKIGVLGSGDVGKVLAAGLGAAGHEVKLGTRDAAKLKDWLAKNPAVSAGSFGEAASFGEAVVLAVLGSAVDEVIGLAGEAAFDGKPVLDATNPLDFSSGKPRLFVGHSDSLGERVQRRLPKAKVVKAFNTVGNALMVNPEFPGGQLPDMFICGDDEGAKRVIEQLCRDLGWPHIDVGGIELSRSLEELCMLWVAYGVKSGTWKHAFKLLRQ